MPTLARKGGVRGLGMLAFPGKKIGAVFNSKLLTIGSKPFRSRPFFTPNQFIFVSCLDETSTPVPYAVVHLFRTVDDLLIIEVTADVNGQVYLPIWVTGPFYIVAYKPGSPDIAGTSLNTIMPDVSI